MYQRNAQFAGRDEIRNDSVIILRKIVNFFLKVPLFSCYSKLCKQKYNFLGSITIFFSGKIVINKRFLFLVYN